MESSAHVKAFSAQHDSFYMDSVRADSFPVPQVADKHHPGKDCSDPATADKCRSGTERSDLAASGTHQAGTKRSELAASGTHQAGTERSELAASGTYQVESERSDSAAPDTYRPVIDLRLSLKGCPRDQTSSLQEKGTGSQP